MNVLAVDIGNTDIKFGVFRDGELVRHWRTSGTRIPPEQFSSAMRNALAQIGTRFDALVYCSVVPHLETAFRQTIAFCCQLRYPMLAVDPSRTRLPIDTGEYPLSQLGMDRLVNACGARWLHPGCPVIVVDFGTATTFDVVNVEGRYLGGAIAPGLQTFASILPSRTARLPAVEIAPVASALGRNTVECLQAGISIGYQGLVEELLSYCHAELHVMTGEQNILHVATGGLAETFCSLAPDKPLFQVIDPLLTLKGLFAIHQHALLSEYSA